MVFFKSQEMTVWTDCQTTGQMTVLKTRRKQEGGTECECKNAPSPLFCDNIDQIQKEVNDKYQPPQNSGKAQIKFKCIYAHTHTRAPIYMNCVLTQGITGRPVPLSVEWWGCLWLNQSLNKRWFHPQEKLPAGVLAYQHRALLNRLHSPFVNTHAHTQTHAYIPSQVQCRSFMPLIQSQPCMTPICSFAVITSRF